MAWVFLCEDDDIELIADTKDQLADKIVQHVKTKHDSDMTHEQAMQELDRGGRQQAA